MWESVIDGSIGYGGNIKGWVGNGNTSHLRTNTHLQRGNLHSGLTLSYNNTDGFVSNDDRLKKQAGLRNDYSFAEGRIGLALYSIEEEYGLPGRVEYPSPDYRKEKKMYTVSVPVTFKGVVSNTFYSKSCQKNRDSSRSIDTLIEVCEAGHNITSSHKNSSGAWEYGGSLLWGEAVSSGFSTQDENSFSIFGQHSYTLTKFPLSTIAGLRLNTYSEFSNTVNPELKLGWNEDAWAVSLSYSRAHNIPSFYKRYDQTPTKAPNPNLEMETSDNVSLDWSLQYWKPLTLSGSLFYNKLTDKISFILGDNGVGQYDNFGRVVRQGAELHLSVIPFANITFDLSYIRLDVANEDTGKTLTSSPKHRANANLIWSHDNFTIISGLFYTSRQYTRSDNTASVPKTLLGNLRSEYSFQKIDLFVEVKNISDKDYINSTGYQGDPRTWVAGFNLRF